MKIVSLRTALRVSVFVVSMVRIFSHWDYGHFLRSVDIIISNTSGSKVDQTNTIKHEKSCTKCDGEASPRPKNKIERIYGLTVCYYVLLLFLTDYSVLLCLCPSRGP